MDRWFEDRIGQRGDRGGECVVARPGLGSDAVVDEFPCVTGARADLGLVAVERQRPCRVLSQLLVGRCGVDELRVGGGGYVVRRWRRLDQRATWILERLVAGDLDVGRCRQRGHEGVSVSTDPRRRERALVVLVAALIHARLEAVLDDQLVIAVALGSVRGKGEEPIDGLRTRTAAIVVSHQAANSATVFAAVNDASAARGCKATALLIASVRRC